MMLVEGSATPTTAGDEQIVELEAMLDHGATATPLQRSKVPAELLGTPTPRRLIYYAAQEWCVILGCWIGITMLPWPCYPLFAVIAGARMQALGVILHDLCHMPRRRMSLEAYVLEAMAWPLLSTIDSFRYHHLRHHRSNGLPEDPYFKPGVDRSLVASVTSVLRLLATPTIWGLRPLIGLGSLLLPRLRAPMARLCHLDRSFRERDDGPELTRCCAADLRQLVWMSPAVAWTIVDPWPAISSCWIPVHILWLFAGYRSLSEHIYDRAHDRRVDTLLKLTLDHHLGWSGRLLFAPRNIGYHLIHHLHPQVALEHLPRLRAWYLAHYPGIYPHAEGPVRKQGR